LKITLFYITTRNEKEASRLGHLAVEHRLAACANIHPIHSIYEWDSKMQNDQECVLILKTISDQVQKLSALIKAHHSYEVPCIMHWEVEVNEEYGAWIVSQVYSPPRPPLLTH
jgi:periplasmic divalent cation tolerance protein